MRKMALFLVLAFGLLVTCSVPSVRAEDYRVPLPWFSESRLVLDGYVLLYQRMDIHDGTVKKVDRVAGTPIYKTGAKYSIAQAQRISRPDHDGLGERVPLSRTAACGVSKGDGRSVTDFLIASIDISPD